MKKYNKDFEDFVRNNAPGTHYSELTKLVNEHFSMNLTQTAVRSYCVRLKIKNGLKHKGIKGKKLFPERIIEFARENAKGLYNKELTLLINKNFGTNFSTKQVKNMKNREHISSGLTGCFEKGHIPSNKGQKMSPEVYKKCSATMFKKGNIPKNHRPIGTERIDSKDGYVHIKIAEPNVWVLKHRYIWEQANGPIPKNHQVCFLDQNKLNFDLSNLKLVNMSIKPKMNHCNYWSKDSEKTKLGLNICALDSAIKSKTKRG